jgi:O-methyltransferase involved in polyketide biosynthesis
MGKLALDAIARRVAATGEPFRTFFDPTELAERLKRMGFKSVEDLGSEEINERYFKGRADGLRVGGRLGRLMSAQL